jgi:hypothetical protein
MSRQSLKQQERDEAIERLKTMLKPGQTVYTVLRHVSRSGMSRTIDLYTFDKKGNKQYLTYNAAKALDYRQNDEGLVVGGCGMDMGFLVVYSLSRVLWRNGAPCTGKNCTSNDHTNGMPRPERGSKKLVHSDGGYTLRQEWL